MKSAVDIKERSQAGFARILFFISFTAMAYFFLGDKIIGALFEYGRFTSDDTLLIWFALGAYSLGLIPSAVSRLAQNVMWSQGDTSGPAKIAFVRVATSITIAASIMWLFDRIGTADLREALPTRRPLASTRWPHRRWSYRPDLPAVVLPTKGPADRPRSARPAETLPYRLAQCEHRRYSIVVSGVLPFECNPINGPSRITVGP